MQTVQPKDLKKLKTLYNNTLKDLVGNRGFENFTKDKDILAEYVKNLEQKYNFTLDMSYINRSDGAVLSRKE